MARTIFADTAYWVAVANPKDQWAPAVERVNATLADARIMTCDEILVEFLSVMSGLGPMLRTHAAAMVRAIMDDPNVTVVPQTRSSLERGLKLYESRADKGYSLVDCIAMETMREHRLNEVLTSDDHFTQEGFVALLKQKGLPGPGT